MCGFWQVDLGQARKWSMVGNALINHSGLMLILRSYQRLTSSTEPVHKHTGSHREGACLQMQRYGSFPPAIFLPPITTYWLSQNSNTTPPHLVLPDAAISQVTVLSMERVSDENEDDTTTHLHSPCVYLSAAPPLFYEECCRCACGT
ncbi:hypothetical protein B0H13DRAFT_1883459 [Mycena leptocephala]|nr:hypothetical protein B0H13DRAFT_1883459 [Mycena leptocephala]